MIKNNILHGTGRKNDTTGMLSPELLEQVRNSLNRSVGGFPFGKIQEVENITADSAAETDYVEKIRSFYPSCEFECLATNSASERLTRLPIRG